MTSTIPGTFPPRPTVQHTDTSSSPLEAYSLSMETLNNIINSLRTIGIELCLDGSLPRIVIIGDQGTGKSSLTESIAGISLPKGKGTTTRCPMEIILKSSVPSVATKYQVSLKKEFKNDSSPTFENKPELFAMTDSVEELRVIIKRAQLILLNPKKPKDKFLMLDETECDNCQCELNFSRDLVVVEIVGAEMDLTFVDLPGIIVNANKV